MPLQCPKSILSPGFPRYWSPVPVAPLWSSSISFSGVKPVSARPASECAIEQSGHCSSHCSGHCSGHSPTSTLNDIPRRNLGICRLFGQLKKMNSPNDLPMIFQWALFDEYYLLEYSLEYSIGPASLSRLACGQKRLEFSSWDSLWNADAIQRTSKAPVDRLEIPLHRLESHCNAHQHRALRDV